MARTDEGDKEHLAMERAAAMRLAKDRETLRRNTEEGIRARTPFALPPERQSLPVRVGKNVVAAGAGIVGAGKEALKDTIEAANYAAHKFVEDPLHPVTRESAAIWPDSPEEKARLVREANATDEGIKAQNAERAALSLPERTHRNVTDLTTGFAQMATDLVGKDRQEPVTEVAKHGYQAGAEALVPMGKSLVNTVTHPELYTADALLNGLPLTGAARSLAAAGGLKLAEQGGRLGRAGEVLHAAAQPGSLSAGVAKLAQRAHVLPGAQQLAEKLEQFLET